ncbi:hypothetical protein K1719_030685 [Acacia pycnantha]|nr:hypothetical protein K1719_030685 [Acacia pycnantha]
METSAKVDNQNFVKDKKVESMTNQEELTCKMKQIIYELEMSQFYHNFRDEIQRKPISKGIQGVLGSETEMQMVIYGIGSIKSEKDDTPKLQLSLAILMKKDFAWIGEIQVFDPILSTIEIQVLESLGCTVLSINEHGRRQTQKPTIFFMPHCDVDLYNNLLEANWEPNLLSNVIIFGNSFDTYIKDLDLLNFSRRFSSNGIGMERRLSHTWETMGHILAARTFTNEFEITTFSMTTIKLQVVSIGLPF